MKSEHEYQFHRTGIIRVAMDVYKYSYGYLTGQSRSGKKAHTPIDEKAADQYDRQENLFLAVAAKEDCRMAWRVTKYLYTSVTNHNEAAVSESANHLSALLVGTVGGILRYQF